MQGRGATAAGPPQQNRLLAAVSVASWYSLRPHRRPKLTPLGTAISEPGSRRTNVYLPTNSITSLLLLMATGQPVRPALRDIDGVAGVALFLGGESTPSRAVVQSGGWSCTPAAPIVQKEFGQKSELQHLPERFGSLKAIESRRIGGLVKQSTRASPGLRTGS